MKKKSLYKPIRDQLQSLIRCTEALDKRREDELYKDMNLFLELLDNVKKQCDIYLQYKLRIIGNINGVKKL